MDPIQVNPRALIVFEGLDKAGKSTQVELLRRRTAEGSATFPHMPSGETAFTQGVYRLLEDHPPRSGLGKQLAHLACHCENVPSIVEALGSKGVVLDRWWWSTMAYGWYSGAIPVTGLSEAAFLELIRAIWAPVVPSVVFFFVSPHEEDPNNVSGVETGYRELARRHTGPVILVPEMGVDDTHQFIVDELLTSGFAQPL